MKSALDFLIVGTGPLGSAIRAAILGALATTLGRLFFETWWQPLILGIVLCSVLLPVAYMISSRDDQDTATPFPAEPQNLPKGEKSEISEINRDVDPAHKL